MTPRAPGGYRPRTWPSSPDGSKCTPMLTAADPRHGIRSGGTAADRKFLAGRVRPCSSPSHHRWGFVVGAPLRLLESASAVEPPACRAVRLCGGDPEGGAEGEAVELPRRRTGAWGTERRRERVALHLRRPPTLAIPARRLLQCW